MKINWQQSSDKIIAISASITAIIALVVAVLEVRTQQEFQKLSVEPYIELGNTGGDSIGYYAFLLTNNGLGPAIVKSGEYSVDGVPVANWEEAVSLSTGNEPPYSNTYSDLYSNRRIKASETVELFKIAPYSRLASDFHQAIKQCEI